MPRPPVSGPIWGWGFNGEGQLGDGTRGTRGDPRTLAWTPSAGVVAVSAGAYHNLVQLADGTVWAWGDQGFHQCGQADFDDRLTPVNVPGVENVVAISAGGWHSLALMPDGTVRAWGLDHQGQLGGGSISGGAAYSPATVVELRDVTAISAGARHNLALLKDGTVRAWGSQSWFQLGNPTPADTPRPREVLQLSDVKAISAGGFHSLALLNDGTVRGWGDNNEGQLGAGTRWWNQYNAPVQALDLTKVKSVAAGDHHSLALREDGSVWAWGYNAHGQLGDGTTANGHRPTQVVGLERITAIAAAGQLEHQSHHNLALQEDGTLWAWGYNNYGQLGDGTKQSRTRSVKVIGVKDVRLFDAGGWHSIAIA